MHLKARFWLGVAIVLLIVPGQLAHAKFQATSFTDSSERKRAIELYDQKKFPEARDLLSAIVKKTPTDHLSWYYLGFVYIQQKKYKDASKALETAIKVNPGFAAAHSGLGYSFLFRGKWREAMREAEAALKIDPKLADAHYVLGVGHLRTNDESAAVTEADAAIALNPQMAPAYLLKSQAITGFLGDVPVAGAGESPVVRRTRFALAAEALQKYIELDPNTADNATWKDQLESLRYYGAPPSPNKERSVYSG